MVFGNCDCYPSREKVQLEDHRYEFELAGDTFKSVKYITGQNTPPIPRHQYIGQYRENKLIFKVYPEMEEWYYRIPARLVGLRELIVSQFIMKYKYLAESGMQHDDRFEQLLCDDIIMNKDNTVMIVTSYMNGQSMKSLMEQAPLNSELKTTLKDQFSRIALALKQHGLVYLDVHPGNFLFDGINLRVLDMKNLLKFENEQPVNVRGSTLKEMMLTELRSKDDFGHWQLMFPEWDPDAKPSMSHFDNYMEYRFALMVEEHAIGWHAEPLQVRSFRKRLADGEDLLGPLSPAFEKTIDQ